MSSFSRWYEYLVIVQSERIKKCTVQIAARRAKNASLANGSHLMADYDNC